MTDFICHITRVVVTPNGEPIFHERATVIEIDDDASGEYVVISQPGDDTPGRGTIAIDAGEWEFIRAAIDEMIGRCRG